MSLAIGLGLLLLLAFGKPIEGANALFVPAGIAFLSAAFCGGHEIAYRSMADKWGGRASKEKDGPIMSVEPKLLESLVEASRRVGVAYGKVMVETQDMTYVPASKLPVPKEVIKEAISLQHILCTMKGSWTSGSGRLSGVHAGGLPGLSLTKPRNA